jgi:hypothetical protein
VGGDLGISNVFRSAGEEDVGTRKRKDNRQKETKVHKTERRNRQS